MKKKVRRQKVKQGISRKTQGLGVRKPKSLTFPVVQLESYLTTTKQLLVPVSLIDFCRNDSFTDRTAEITARNEPLLPFHNERPKM